SEQINVAPGSAVVVASVVQFLLVFLLAPRYGLAAGWLRRRRAVPQQLVEDVLGCVLRSPTTNVPVSDIVNYVEGREDRIRKAIRWLQRQELATVRSDHVELTEAGVTEGRRLLRAHRLWETYLQHLGTPVDELHEQAHRLEHVHDEEAVDYLDDKLGHPLQDPHGSEIPEDFVHLVPGEPVKAALLREGHRAEIVQLDPEAQGTSLQVAMVVETGPREADGTIWTFRLPDDSVVRLDHATADAVLVRLLE
ncbi:MAG: iron dependent repressor, metal binding and dimerization domain protein, partial [Pirellulaceae bacterium]